MKDSDYGSLETHRVQDEQQAKILSDTKAFGYFRPFLAQTSTVSQAAEKVACNLDTMLYRVKTFLKAGLLEVVRIEKRAGRPIKHYRSVYDAYFIPFSTTPFATFEEEAQQMLQSNEEMIIRALASSRRTLNRHGKRIYRDDLGEVTRHTATDEGEVLAMDDLPHLTLEQAYENMRATELFSDELYLTHDEAKALLSQLYTLWRDNKLVEEKNRNPYLLQVALVPREN